MFDGRKVAFKALVGSHNYNLNDETSDRDYKYFVFPTFDDLYDGKFYSKPSQVSEELDYDVHDIRKLPNILFKSNINFLEVFFSNEVVLGTSNRLLKELFALKDELAQMNVPYLYHACKGMYFNKTSLLMKGTAGTKHLVAKFGYDTKQALHAYRCLDFAERFLETDFTDFKAAMTYAEKERDFMLAIKYGTLTLEQYNEMVGQKYEKFLTLKEKYDKMEANVNTKADLDFLVKELVNQNL